MKSRGIVRRLVTWSLASLSLALPVASANAEADADALALLRRTTDYVGSLKRFSVEGQAVLEVVLSSGQKLQFDHGVKLVVERPNKLRAARRGEIADQVFYYDGESLKLHDEAGKVYAATDAPKTLEDMLDFARDELDIVAPAADLIYADAYEELTADMTSGFVVSENALLAGERSTHLAFRKPGVDIQIWIRNGDQPLPLKYVLTTTDLIANPQFILTLSGWDTNPRITAETFRFDPPPTAKRIDFVRSTASPSGAP